MNSTENLFIVASEECAEIQQCISKTLRFGVDDCHPDRPDSTNELELLTEYYQLQAVIEMLQEKGALKTLSAEEIETIKVSKKAKVLKYAEYSKKMGLLN